MFYNPFLILAGKNTSLWGHWKKYFWPLNVTKYQILNKPESLATVRVVSIKWKIKVILVKINVANSFYRCPTAYGKLKLKKSLRFTWNQTRALNLHSPSRRHHFARVQPRQLKVSNFVLGLKIGSDKKKFLTRAKKSFIGSFFSFGHGRSEKSLSNNFSFPRKNSIRCFQVFFSQGLLFGWLKKPPSERVGGALAIVEQAQLSKPWIEPTEFKTELSSN